LTGIKIHAVVRASAACRTEACGFLSAALTTGPILEPKPDGATPVRVSHELPAVKKTLCLPFLGR